MNRHEKADALLANGDVRVLAADEDSVAALVVGTHGTYQVGVYREGTEVVRECSCPYSRFHPIRECSHLLAVGKVWRPEPVAETIEKA